MYRRSQHVGIEHRRVHVGEGVMTFRRQIRGRRGVTVEFRERDRIICGAFDGLRDHVGVEGELRVDGFARLRHTRLERRLVAGGASVRASVDSGGAGIGGPA